MKSTDLARPLRGIIPPIVTPLRDRDTLDTTGLGVVGLKDSSGNFEYFKGVQQMLSDRPRFTLLLGAEELVADGVLHGAHGGICGGANLHPRLYVELYEAAVAKDAARVATLQATV